MSSLQALVKGSSSASVLEKALSGERFDFDDGVALMRSRDMYLVGLVADIIRRKCVGDTVTFAVSYNLNYTNLCAARCSICAFYKPYSRDFSDPGAYTLGIGEALAQVGEAVSLGTTEVHMAGGLNPELPLEYYEQLFREVKARWPWVTLKALSPAEIHFISGVTGNTVREVLKRLKSAGLDGTTGGGAEIFDERIRDEISTGPKCTGEEWLSVAEEAHRLGIPGNSTMLYGHVEGAEHRVDHILRLREAQDRAPGFLSFIPLKYSPEKTELYLSGRVTGPTSSLDDLRVVAVSRLLLAGSINNIALYWVSLGKQVTQTALTYGGNDLVGTAFSEKVFRATGREETASTEELAQMIRETGRTPAQRDTFYRILKYL